MHSVWHEDNQLTLNWQLDPFQRTAEPKQLTVAVSIGIMSVSSKKRICARFSNLCIGMYCQVKNCNGTVNLFMWP
jgi:hypothetical protein